MHMRSYTKPWVTWFKLLQTTASGMKILSQYALKPISVLSDASMFVAVVIVLVRVQRMR